MQAPRLEALGTKKKSSCLEVWVFQGLFGRQALLRVDREHLRDQVLRFRADVRPVLVVEAVHALLDLGK